eukprot:524212-Rhodomonas_salina.4
MTHLAVALGSVFPTPRRIRSGVSGTDIGDAAARRVCWSLPPQSVRYFPRLRYAMWCLLGHAINGIGSEGVGALSTVLLECQRYSPYALLAIVPCDVRLSHLNLSGKLLSAYALATRSAVLTTPMVWSARPAAVQY